MLSEVAASCTFLIEIFAIHAMRFANKSLEQHGHDRRRYLHAEVASFRHHYHLNLPRILRVLRLLKHVFFILAEKIYDVVGASSALFARRNRQTLVL